MRKFLQVLFLLFIPLSNNLILQNGFPIWLKDGDKQTDQTSGITYIGNKGDWRVFLICDDIGKIHRIFLKDKKLRIETLKFNKRVEDYLSTFMKIDFEEIVYDKSSNQVYVSIEGNGINYKNEVGIYKLLFKNDDIFNDEIVGIEKIQFPEHQRLIQYTGKNIGFEGLAISDNRIFLGLEGFQIGSLFIDSTLIYVVDKKSKAIIKEISTRSYNIHTCCGLYALDDHTIYGIDRNRQNLFRIKFDNNYDVIDLELLNLSNSIPDRPDLKYVSTIEGITVDDSGFIYTVDDPWKKYFIPDFGILKQLDKTTRENFNNYVPLLYKYKLK